MAECFMVLHFNKKNKKDWQTSNSGKYTKSGKFVEKFAEHSVSNIVHMADNYGHPAEPTTCYLALYESFEIERNDEGRGWIRVSREFVTKLNVDDQRGHARRSWYAPKANAETIFEDIQWRIAVLGSQFAQEASGSPVCTLFY